MSLKPRWYSDMFFQVQRLLKKTFEIKKFRIGFVNAAETCSWVDISTPIMCILTHTTSIRPTLPQNPLKTQGNWGRIIIFSKIESRDLTDIKSTSKRFQTCVRLSQNASLIWVWKWDFCIFSKFFSSHRRYLDHENGPKSENTIFKESSLSTLINVSGQRCYPYMFLYVLKYSKKIFQVKKV